MSSSLLNQQTYDDPVKQLTREKLRDFIKRNLLTIVKPKDVKVVCFPGAEVDGEEAIEVKEVYDPLGIPRENIVGLEYNKEKANRLRKADLGIDVKDVSDLEFFTHTRKRFHVISLDYTGHQTLDRIKTIQQIGGKGLLGNFGIIATNFNVQRESIHTQRRLTAYHFARSYLRDPFISKEESREIADEYYRRIDVDDFDLEICRKAVSDSIPWNLGGGRANMMHLPAYTAHPLVAHVEQNMLRTWDDQESLEKARNSLRKGGMDEGECEAFLKDPRRDKQEWERQQRAAMAKYIAKAHSLDEKTSMLVASYAITRQQEGYFANAIERYKYTSNKGSSMQFDLFFFQRDQKFLNKIDEVVRIPERGYIIVNPHDLPWKKWEDKVWNLLQDSAKFDYTLPEPVYLGSSYVPPRRKEWISQKDTVDLIKLDCTPEEILAQYRVESADSERDLHAWRAIVTMRQNMEQGRTYSPNVVKMVNTFFEKLQD